MKGPNPALFLPVALIGNGIGAASFMWQELHPVQLLFACMFGYSVRWAIDLMPDSTDGRPSDKDPNDRPLLE
jgi:hypothetical protein